jgi:predicted permease
MESIGHDIRYGLRALRQSPGFCAAAVVTLAFGIGASTAIFSMFDAFILRPLPVKEPRRLALIKCVDASGKTEGEFPDAVFKQFRDRNQSFTGIFAYDATRVSLTAGGEPEFVAGDFVSGDYFDILGVRAAIGRTFTADDDRPGREPLAVISHNYWKQRFGSDRSAIGAVITVGGVTFHIVGVTPAGFCGRHAAGKTADVILPMFLQSRLGLKDHNTFELMARLKPGVTLPQASADLDVIYRQALEAGLAGPQTSGRTRIHIMAEPGIRGDAGSYDGLTQELRFLMAIVGIGLLIASSNVASLLLARGAARQNEIAIRLALGAGRGRVVRQLLVENLLLGLFGGVLGLLLAHWLTSGLVFLLSLGRDAIVFELDPNPRVLAFTAAISLLTGILFGLVPAFAGAKADLNVVLKGSTDHARSPRDSRQLTAGFVVPQVTLSVVLLVGAGLLLRGLQDLYRFNPGFERNHVVMAWVMPVMNGYDRPREIALYRELFDRTNAVPGVQSASVARLRLVFGTSYRNVSTKGAAPGEEIQRVYCNQVGSRFFETMRIPLLLGREFSRTDTEATPHVAVISERLARRLFPYGNPIGRRIDLSGPKPDVAVAVIGVVGDIRHHPDEREAHEAVYIPYDQAPSEELGQMNILVRTANPGIVIPAIRGLIQALDRNLPLRDIQTQEDEIDEYLAGQRSLATLSTLLGIFALLLTAVGLYGTMSYTVGRRTREFGIRMALGARGNDLIGMVLGQAFRQIGLGVAIGVPAALLTAKLARSAVLGIGDADPISLCAVIAILCAVALVAAWLPARRATNVDPLVAIR